jgi:hypothetical protein
MSADPRHERGKALPLPMLPLVGKRLLASECELNAAQNCPQKMSWDAECGLECKGGLTMQSDWSLSGNQSLHRASG